MSNFPDSATIIRQALPNGITVLAYENFASQSVVIEGLVRAGSVVETRAQAGLANFTAACLMRGAAGYTFAEIYENLEAVGADLGFSGGNQTTGFAANGLVEDIDLLLDLLARSLRSPTFPGRQVDLVRGQIMTGLAMRANDTRRMANLIFNETLYPDHPYGRSSRGYPETIAQISRDDLADFHAHYYGPAGMIVTIVGAIKAEMALEKITAVLGDWRHPDRQPLTAVPDVIRPSQLTHLHHSMPDKNQSDIVLGLPGPRRSAPDYMDASLVNTILGVFGMMGRIGRRVREEQGLAYYAYSRLQGGLGPAPWVASAGVAPENVAQAIESIRLEIERIQDEPVPADELADSLAFRTGSLPVSLETNSGLAGTITDMELYDLGLDYLQNFPDMIQAITPARIQAAAQKYLSAEQIVVAVAGPDSS